MSVLRLPWPRPPRAATPVLPVFLPYAACPCRCIFCAQHVQSNTQPEPVPDALERLRHTLQERGARGARPAEVAFYGGTFTALPAAELATCLALTRTAIDNGTIVCARCSTRPDAVTPDILRTLRDAGFTTIELGVQSFNGAALRCAQRGYDADTALRACALVREAGLTLGVQLMPGMPGVTPQIFLQDVAAALAAGAQMLRFYPCLVLEGTLLAHAWRTGSYAPWALAQTVATLAEGWLMANKAGVPVIRMGLAHEVELHAHTLAGPQHPALGALVQSTALHATVTRAMPGTLRALHAPRWTQGYFWGHKGSLREAWAALGIEQTNVVWHAFSELHLH